MRCSVSIARTSGCWPSLALLAFACSLLTKTSGDRDRPLHRRYGLPREERLPLFTTIGQVALVPGTLASALEPSPGAIVRNGCTLAPALEPSPGAIVRNGTDGWQASLRRLSECNTRELVDLAWAFDHADIAVPEVICALAKAAPSVLHKELVTAKEKSAQEKSAQEKPAQQPAQAAVSPWTSAAQLPAHPSTEQPAPKVAEIGAPVGPKALASLLSVCCKEPSVATAPEVVDPLTAAVRLVLGELPPRELTTFFLSVMGGASA